MGNRERVVVGVTVASVGSLMALVAGGPTIGACLGSLGVTAVRCAAHGGGLPSTGAVGPLLAAAWGAGLLFVLRVPAARWAISAGVAGAAIGAASYLAARPRTLEGPDFDGAWLSIALPIEPLSLGSWALAGALLAVLAVRAGVRIGQSR